MMKTVATGGLNNPAFLSLVTPRKVPKQFRANMTVLQRLGARHLHFPFPSTTRKLYESLLLTPHWPALCHMVTPSLQGSLGNAVFGLASQLFMCKGEKRSCRTAHNLYYTSLFMNCSKLGTGIFSESPRMHLRGCSHKAIIIFLFLGR